MRVYTYSNRFCFPYIFSPLTIFDLRPTQLLPAFVVSPLSPLRPCQILRMKRRRNPVIGRERAAISLTCLRVLRWDFLDLKDGVRCQLEMSSIPVNSNHNVVWWQAYKTFCKFGESLLARSSKLQTTLAELEGDQGDDQGDQVHSRITKPPICIRSHVFPTDPPLASKMIQQIRCIEVLEAAIGILNAEYEKVELVKGEVGKLKNPKGLDDATTKQFQPYLLQTPVCLCSHVFEFRFWIQKNFHFGTISSLGWLRRLKNKWDLPLQRATGDIFVCTFINDWCCIFSFILLTLVLPKHMNKFCCKVRKGNHCWDHGQVSELQIPHSGLVINGFIPLL